MSAAIIDLVWLGDCTPPPWGDGKVWRVSEPTPAAVAAVVERQIEVTDAEACLFWDSSFGIPDISRMQKLLEKPRDVWHAGLRLGMGGLPGIIDFIHPTWMYNRDPDPDVEATFWRLSLRACLIRTEVLSQLGGPHPRFRSLEGAALEMGHRYIRRGALVRHVPDLAPEMKMESPVVLPLEDELRFALYRFRRKWARWALGRALVSGYARRRKLLRAWSRVRNEHVLADPEPLNRPRMVSRVESETHRVSVLIPTLERYPYLDTLLDQLRHQTVRPHEVIVVDQTPRPIRDLSYRERFSDLPLRVIEQDHPGQCTSRNAGIEAATGDYILFLDDDDEIESDLIESHLRTLTRFDAEVSSGVAHEVGAGPLPPDFQLLRVSDVFPANNTLIRKDVLAHSGLFDLAFNRGERADGDLGMRVYLSGALMVLNPAIAVLHHHAPRGGLRAHRARVITYASSRQRLMHRHLPSVSEIYLMRRYFSERQIREALWMRAVGTLSSRGRPWRRLVKIGLGLLSMPDTLHQIRKRCQAASAMLQEYPLIPILSEKVGSGAPTPTGTAFED